MALVREALVLHGSPHHNIVVVKARTVLAVRGEVADTHRSVRCDVGSSFVHITDTLREDELTVTLHREHGEMSDGRVDRGQEVGVV